MRTEGAELVAELLRKHRHSPVDQIYRSTTGLRLLIDHIARLHIMGDVSDMDSYFVISIFKLLERESVVKVLRISRVNRECQYITEVLSALKILSSNIFRYAVGCICDLRLETVWKGIFRKDSMHLGVVLARLSEHIDDMSARAHLMARPVIHDRSDLHARTGLQLLTSVSVLSELEHLMDRILFVSQRLEVSGLVLRFCSRLAPDLMSAVALPVRFGKRNRDVVWHETALHEHPGLISYDMENTDERPWRPFYDLHHLAFPALVGLLTRHCHTHGISMKSTPCL